MKNGDLDVPQMYFNILDVEHGVKVYLESTYNLIITFFNIPILRSCIIR